MARQLGAAGEVAVALNVVGAAQAARGAFEAGIASLREAAQLAEEQGDPDTLMRAYGLEDVPSSVELWWRPRW
jgi:hypothetical protein